MDKVKEKVPASGGAETSTSKININKSITPIGENVKRGKKEIYKSRVYTDRPSYADLEAPTKFQAIQGIIATHLKRHPNAICSYSGGSDSDIMIDLIESTREIFPSLSLSHKICVLQHGAGNEGDKGSCERNVRKIRC